MKNGAAVGFKKHLPLLRPEAMVPGRVVAAAKAAAVEMAPHEQGMKEYIWGFVKDHAVALAMLPTVAALNLIPGVGEMADAAEFAALGTEAVEGGGLALEGAAAAEEGSALLGGGTAAAQGWGPAAQGSASVGGEGSALAGSAPGAGSAAEVQDGAMETVEDQTTRSPSLSGETTMSAFCRISSPRGETIEEALSRAPSPSGETVEEALARAPSPPWEAFEEALARAPKVPAREPGAPARPIWRTRSRGRASWRPRQVL